MGRAAGLIAALLLAGCAGLPARDGSDLPSHRADVRTLEAWQMQGRVAVATATDGFSGGLEWRQDGGAAEIILRGPLGAPVLQLTVDRDRIAMTDDRGEVIVGPQVHERLAAELGASLPLTELRYWLVGTPAPGLPHRESVGADGRLAALHQSGWEVRYGRFRAVGAYELPVRLELSGGRARVRVVASDWRLDR